MTTVANDRVLVEKSKARDHAAFAELLHQNSPMARRAIRAITRNPADVDDVMQDTLVNAFQGLRSFNYRSKFSTWLTRIAINNALMLLRRQKNKREIGLEIHGENPQATSFQLTDNTLDPEQTLIRDQSIQTIRKAFQTLPRTLREYAERRCIQDLSNREVASSLRITLGAGKSRYFHVRRRLK